MIVNNIFGQCATRAN